MNNVEVLEILQILTHYSLHFLVPGLISWIFFRKDWKRAWIIMIATMLVDIDHIFACTDLFPIEGGMVSISPSHILSCQEIYVPNRCGIGFHPLHSYYAISIYMIMSLFPKIRIIAIGLLFHMVTDFQDCYWM